MFRLSLVLFSAFTLPASAIDACSLLNPIEVAATLRGPGVVLAFHAKTDQDHFRTCYLARVSQAGSSEEEIKRLQSEAPLTLTVVVRDDLGAKGFALLKPEPGTTETEVPGIGERALLRHGAKAEKLYVAGGSNFLTLGLTGENANQRQQDLLVLAREALTTNFDASRVVQYEVADRALANDKAAFETDPKNSAILLIAMKRLDQARIYSRRAIAANPDDSDALYQLALLDWWLAFQPRMQIRAHLGLRPEENLRQEMGPACTEVRAANKDGVEEGIAALVKAINLRPDFDDAMAYLNLLYRERADYECDDGGARAADLKSADEWVAKTIATRGSAKVVRNSSENVLRLPAFIPPPPPPPPGLGTSASGGAVPGGTMGGVIGSVLSSTPVAGPMSQIPLPIQVASGVSTGLLITKVDPVYPPLARQARIQGTVVLRAIIGKDGSIKNLTLLNGHPMLVPAAIDAVKQWKYKPYLLNEEPVEVDTQVQVNFTLSGG